MDEQLEARLEKAHMVSEQLALVDRNHLELEANEKPLWAKLFLETQGTVAEREARVYVNPDWLNFAKGLAESKSRMNLVKRDWELAMKAFDAAYLTLKIQGETLKRGR